MPTYRNDSRGTVIIKNIDGVPCPIGPKESIATFEEVNLSGLSLVDSNPVPDPPKPGPEIEPETEPIPEPEPILEPEPEPDELPEPEVEFEPEPEVIEPEPAPEPEKKAKWYKKIFRRKNHADLSQ